MKTLSTLFLVLLFSSVSLFATDHVINTEGLTYSPDLLNAAVGDNVTINATGNHPTTEVSQATWDADGTTALAGGFGTHTTSFTFMLTEPGTIYYVCDNHVNSGMKGQIVVSTVGLEELTSVLFNLGPNPVVDGEMNYTLDGIVDEQMTLEFIDMRGRSVITQSIQQGEGIIALQLKTGNYIAILRRPSGEILKEESIMVE